MAKLSTTIALTSHAGPFPSGRLTVPLRKAVMLSGITSGQWHILLVRDEEIKELHLRHLGDPTTTDVLTFDMRDETANGKRRTLELESVLCVDEARRRARELGHPVGHELLLYAVHSLLHVTGYDDVTEAGARRMHQREDELLSAMGIGAVYERNRETARRGR